MSIPPDYLERVYAGVIGKVVGVYLGQPFEGYDRQRILSELGYVRYYVHEKIQYPLSSGRSRPLVVTDDDVSGTFMAVRALEEHGARILTAEEVGKTWLNNIVEDRSVFWWGGRGASTEHTAYLNLKQGIPGGLSGAIETNGKTVAEQIGGEIFIDGFPMCTPGKPDLAAKLAKAAASVSHDGEGVYGAVMWACMEAEAFVSNDVDHLIDTGLHYIPGDSILAKSVQDVRTWAKEDDDWEVTRQRIEDKYGNDKFAGACSVIPNHAIKVMSLLYGGHSFHEGIHIIVTCGWDTDSNGGNMGTLLGIMHGLEGFENGPDWRGPLADRAIISTADGGYSINNCTRIAYDIANVGHKFMGAPPPPAPKKGAQYHFSFPRGVQGFHTPLKPLTPDLAKVEQGQGPLGSALAVRLTGFSVANDAVEVMTNTFMEEYFLQSAHYMLQASPLLYPGQKLEALFSADTDISDAVTVTFRLKTYGPDGVLSYDGPSCRLDAGEHRTLSFTIPDAYYSQPIKEVGFKVTTKSTRAISGTVWLDSLRWTGAPRTKLVRPSNAAPWPGSDAEPWRRAWVNNATTFPYYFPNFLISKSQGEGGIFQGSRDWFDYKVTARKFVNNTPGGNGIAARVQGLNRWYAVIFRPGKIVLVKALDEQRKVLASRSHGWSLDKPYDVSIRVCGGSISGHVDGKLVLEAADDQFASGGMGMMVTDGSCVAQEFDIEPVDG